MSDEFDEMFYPDMDDDDDYWFPADFVDKDISDSDVELLHNIQRVMGQSVQNIIVSSDDFFGSGRENTLRGTRFSSGAEALIWLFRRGIFLYSSLVRFPDGTWGVAIGSSQPAASEPTNDLSF